MQLQTIEWSLDMSDDEKSFMAGLASKFEPLEAEMNEHLQDNFDEMLPHPLMVDYCRVTLKAEPDTIWIRQLLSELEENFSEVNDDGIRNVIAVSFVEHLPSPDSEHAIIGMLGKKLRKQYDIIFGLR